jgi:hypothetical protein
MSNLNSPFSGGPEDRVPSQGSRQNARPSGPPLNKIRAVLLVALLTATAFAVEGTATSALINKALDSQQSLNLNATLPDVIKSIGDQTGVRLQPDPAIWDLLPWGDQTTITAKIENHTLREELTAITRHLGLEYALTDEAVEIRPMPPLRRLGRRATVDEIAVLATMAGSPMNLPTDRITVADLLTAVDKRLVDLKSPFAVDDRAADATRSTTITIPRNATIADALEAISTQTGATWYPWGTSIVVVPKEEQIRTQLNKVLTARYNAVDVDQVLLELSQRAGVRFIVEPGAYQKVPAADRSITLLLDNASIQQGLDSISGHTGLAFEVTDAGVRVYFPAAENDSTTRPVR